MENQNKLGSSDFFMLLAVFFWGLNFPLIKIALGEFTPLGFNGIRLFFASLVLVIGLLASKEGLSIKKADIWTIIFLSLIGNTIFQMFFIHGLNFTTASNTAIIMAMTPVFIALLSSFLRQERIHWAAWLGIGISFVGFYFVMTKKPGTFNFSGQGMKGDLMILFGNICWAVYTVLARPLLKTISPLKLTSVTMLIGTVFYLPFCAHDIFHLRLAEISPRAWGMLFYSGLFALAICYVIWYRSVKRVGNSKTAIYGYITPVFTVIFAYIFLAEKITLLQVAGALIIFAGVYLARSGYREFRSDEEVRLP